MAHKPCDKYTWCDMHDTTFDDDTLHSKHVGYGIEFEFNEASGETSVSWQPNWNDWTMKPGEVYQEVDELKVLLERLAYEFRQFVEEVAH